MLAASRQRAEITAPKTRRPGRIRPPRPSSQLTWGMRSLVPGTRTRAVGGGGLPGRATATTAAVRAMNHRAHNNIPNNPEQGPRFHVRRASLRDLYRTRALASLLPARADPSPITTTQRGRPASASGYGWTICGTPLCLASPRSPPPQVAHPWTPVQSGCRDAGETAPCFRSRVQ